MSRHVKTICQVASNEGRGFPEFLVVHDGQVPKLPQPRRGHIESGAEKVSDVVRKKVNAAQPRGRNLQINPDQPGST